MGTLVLKAVLSSPTLNVTVLSRPTSTNTFPDGVQVIRSDYSPSSLVGAFRGQDAVVSLVGRDGYAEQKKLIDAALEAGVKRFIPSEYGNNSADPRVRALAPILEGKKTKVDFLKQHESQMSWTVIITGAFFDWVSGIENDSKRENQWAGNLLPQQYGSEMAWLQANQLICVRLSKSASWVSTSKLAALSSMTRVSFLSLRAPSRKSVGPL